MREGEKNKEEIKNTEDILTIIEDEQRFVEFIKTSARALKDWKTLCEFEEKSIYDFLNEDRINEWSRAEKMNYLESVGRLVAALCPGGNNLDFTGTENFERSLYWESMRLAELSKFKAEAINDFSKLGAYAVAMVLNTNQAGGQGKVYKKFIKESADKFAKDGDEAACEALVNPFHIGLGTEVFSFDKKTGILKKNTVAEFIIDGADGLVIFDSGESMEIDELNGKLAGNFLSTSSSLKSGENIWGGVDFFKEQILPFKIKDGAMITIDLTTPVNSGTAKVKCIGSNLAEIEKEYGNGYLKSLHSFPKDTPLLTVDLEMEDGRILKGIDARTIKVIK